MKGNLKNPLWETNPKNARKILEKELRQKLKFEPWQTDLIKEILGEKEEASS